MLEGEIRTKMHHLTARCGCTAKGAWHEALNFYDWSVLFNQSQHESPFIHTLSLVSNLFIYTHQ